MELVVGVGGGEDAGGVRVHRGGRDRWRDKNDGLGGSETDAVAECRLAMRLEARRGTASFNESGGWFRRARTRVFY